MQISGSTSEWEQWTGLEFREEGDYLFPGGLAPLHISGGQGLYWEPHVWMLHDVSS